MLTRTQLRRLVQQTLSGETAAGERVYDSKLRIPDEADLPIINIFTPSELAQDGLLIVSLEIHAAVMAEQDENVAVLLDNLCQEIRTVLRRFWEASGEFTASYLGTDILFEAEAAQPFAAGQITYQVEVLIEE